MTLTPEEKRQRRKQALKKYNSSDKAKEIRTNYYKKQVKEKKINKTIEFLRELNEDEINEIINSL